METKIVDQVIELVKANPYIPLKELAEKCHIKSPSNIHYHIKNLEAQGRLAWKGTVRTRKRPESHERKRSRWERGDVKLPKLSAKRQAELIEQVVLKAQGAGIEGEEFAGEDVVRIARGRLIRNNRLRASRIA